MEKNLRQRGVLRVEGGAKLRKIIVRSAERKKRQGEALRINPTSGINRGKRDRGKAQGRGGQKLTREYIFGISNSRKGRGRREGNG